VLQRGSRNFPQNLRGMIAPSSQASFGPPPRPNAEKRIARGGPRRPNKHQTNNAAAADLVLFDREFVIFVSGQSSCATTRLA
jgi:hypothetical protein